MSLKRWWHLLVGRGALLVAPLLPLLHGGCVHLQRLEKQSLYSDAMHRRMPYAVYLPPGYDPAQQYPVVYFLHGGGDDYKAFERFGGVEFLDRAIRDGDAPPFILVAPTGELGFWMNWHDGTRRYEDHFINEVIPRVERDFPVRPGRANRVIFGISMGGFGAMNLASKHPELFSAVAALSGPMYSWEEARKFMDSTMARLLGIERIFGGKRDIEFMLHNGPYEKFKAGRTDLQGMRVLLQVCEDDRLELPRNNRRLHELLLERGVESTFRLVPGRHKWVSWNPTLPAVLGFLLGTPGS